MGNTKEGNRRRGKKFRDARADFLRAYKSERGCGMCGEKDWACLDFHHTNKSEKNRKLVVSNSGDKKGRWYQLKSDELMAELDKKEGG